MKFTRQDPLQSYKVPHQLKFLGELLDKAYESAEKLVSPIFAVQRCLLGITCNEGDV